ncbi:MAG: Card1-like endonuclease domain-containing protein [Panacagrimonas sp.]
MRACSSDLSQPGGWLEYRLFYALLPLTRAGLVQDVAAGVQVTAPGQMLAEWDVVFVANNNLYIIECKSGAAKGEVCGVGMETLFKLATLAAMSGLGAYPMLVSLARPTATESARAREMGIELVNLGARGSLTERIQQWIENTELAGRKGSR